MYDLFYYVLWLSTVPIRRGLKSVDGTDGSADPYVNVKLLSKSGSTKAKKKTEIMLQTLSPVFDKE